VWRAFDSIILDFSEVERDKLFWANAERYYRI
jgi:predicted TIM-barrel fold metal-dependent hydrolase